jgi:hypothetical protein
MASCIVNTFHLEVPLVVLSRTIAGSVLGNRVTRESPIVTMVRQPGSLRCSIRRRRDGTVVAGS